MNIPAAQPGFEANGAWRQMAHGVLFNPDRFQVNVIDWHPWG